MKNKKRVIALITSLVLLVWTTMPVSAASYVGGTISGTKISANGSLTWTRSSSRGTAKATTRSSDGVKVTVSASVTFLNSSGKVIQTYSSGSKSDDKTISVSKSVTNAKAYKNFKGTHKATYSGGSWSGGTTM